MNLLDKAVAELSAIQSRDITQECADALLNAIMDDNIITWRFSLEPVRMLPLCLTIQDQHRNLCAQFNNYLLEKVLPVASDETCVTFILIYTGRSDLAALATHSAYELIIEAVEKMTANYRYHIR